MAAFRNVNTGNSVYRANLFWWYSHSARHRLIAEYTAHAMSICFFGLPTKQQTSTSPNPNDKSTTMILLVIISGVLQLSLMIIMAGPKSSANQTIFSPPSLRLLTVVVRFLSKLLSSTYMIHDYNYVVNLKSAYFAVICF